MKKGYWSRFCYNILQHFLFRRTGTSQQKDGLTSGRRVRIGETIWFYKVTWICHFLLQLLKWYNLSESNRKYNLEIVMQHFCIQTFQRCNLWHSEAQFRWDWSKRVWSIRQKEFGIRLREEEFWWNWPNRIRSICETSSLKYQYEWGGGGGERIDWDEIKNV